jgi:raffinose/stachyose/melibiose transport system permease protein
MTLPEPPAAAGDLPARPRFGHRRGGVRKVPWAFAAPALVFVLLFQVIAPILAGWYAFTDWDGIGSATWVGLDNFREILSTPATEGAFWNTLKLAGSFLVLVNVIGLALALALHRTLKTRNFIRSLFFLPFVLAPLATSYLWQYIFDYSGPLNRLLGAIGLETWQQPWLGDPGWALWTILVVMVWQYSGLTMIIYLAGLTGIPDELDEAAAVDGASSWTRFRRITLPLLAPAITINATLTLIIGLRVFDQVLALTGGGPVDASETLATQVYKQTFVLGRFGFGAAFALLLSALILLVTIAQITILRAREARI